MAIGTAVKVEIEVYFSLIAKTKIKLLKIYLRACKYFRLNSGISEKALEKYLVANITCKIDGKEVKAIK